MARRRKRSVHRGLAGISGPTDAQPRQFHTRHHSNIKSGLKPGGKRRMGARGMAARRRPMTRAGFAHRG